MSDIWMRARGPFCPAPPPAPPGRGGHGAHATRPPREGGGWPAPRANPSLPAAAPPVPSRRRALRRYLKRPRPAAAAQKPAPSDAASLQRAGPGPVPRFLASRTRARPNAGTHKALQVARSRARHVTRPRRPARQPSLPRQEPAGRLSRDAHSGSLPRPAQHKSFPR